MRSFCDVVEFFVNALLAFFVMKGFCWALGVDVPTHSWAYALALSAFLFARSVRDGDTLHDIVKGAD
jgi:hypothetical protein